MRPVFARRAPNDHYFAVANLFGREHWHVARKCCFALSSNPFLGLVHHLARKPFCRQDRLPAGLLDADDDISAVQAVDVVRKCANRLEDLAAGCARIPVRLKL